MLGMLAACNPPPDRNVPPDDLVAISNMPATNFREVGAGTGRAVMPGDRVTIHLIGRYAGRGEGSDPFADGPFTFIAPSSASLQMLAPAVVGARVGARRKFTQPVLADSATGVRMASYTGAFVEQEFFRYRNDRGDLAFETEVIVVCRPRELSFMRGNKFETHISLGCR